VCRTYNNDCYTKLRLTNDRIVSDLMCADILTDCCKKPGPTITPIIIIVIIVVVVVVVIIYLFAQNKQ